MSQYQTNLQRRSIFRSFTIKQRYIFHHDHYYHTLKGQIGEGIPVFHGVRQRGGGLGSVLGSIAKYAIPLIQKYIIPHAKSAAVSTLSDVASGSHSIKQALKRNGVGFLRNVGSEILNTTKTKTQSGSGITRKKKNPYKRSTTKKSRPKQKQKRQPVKKSSRKNKKTKVGLNRRSRLDIFS